MAPDQPLWLQVPILKCDRAMTAQLTRAVERGYRALVLDLDPKPDDAIDGAATWRSVARVRDSLSLPIIVKGIVRGEDAKQAREHGASGVLVSCLPRSPHLISAIDVLAEVTGAVGGECEVLIAGGVRRGIDILKAVALGASACVIDRPLAYAHAVAGSSGVAAVYRMLLAELSYAMETCGIPSPDEATRDLVDVPVLAL